MAGKRQERFSYLTAALPPEGIVAAVTAELEKFFDTEGDAGRRITFRVERLKQPKGTYHVLVENPPKPKRTNLPE